MATENVKVLKLDTNPAQTSVKDLKNELKELRNTMLSCEQGTEEYNAALTRAAEIQHTLKEQMQEVNATAMDFGQIASNCTQAVGGLVGGFQAAIAVMNLFGAENEDVIKTLKTMQQLMAITQALPAIDKGVKAFKRLGIAIKASTTALKGLSAAAISTGIGALVVVLGLLIANLDKVAKLFGINIDSAEKWKKKLEELKKAQLDFNATLQQYDTLAQGVQFEHKEELAAMDRNIEKMKAEGKTSAEITAQQQKDLERKREIANEEKKLWDAQIISIQTYFKTVTNETLSARNAYWKLSDYQKILSNEQIKLNQLQEKGDKKKIAAQETVVKKYQDIVDALKKYINLQNLVSETDIKLDGEESRIEADRIAKRKKLKEDWATFNTQITIDLKKNQEKELAEVDKAEKARIKELKEFRKEGIITHEEYEKRETEITEIYNKQRDEISFKYAQKESQRREEILKEQANINKDNIELWIKTQEQLLNQEGAAIDVELKKRLITFTEYYNQQGELAKKNYEIQKKALKDRYDTESELISEQINERNELLGKVGISDEEKNKILQDIGVLTKQLTNLAIQYKIDLQNLTGELNATLAEAAELTINFQMDTLRELTEGVVASMDAIAAAGDGISTEWATAFDTMSNALINLGQKIREGGAQWTDYGNLAVAAFSAAGSMMNALADEQDETTEEGFEQQKKYQIAASTMNMLGGIVNAWTSAMNPANAWMTVWGQIAMGTAMSAMILGTGLAQIQKIQQQQFGGGGTNASINTGAVSSLIAPVQYTSDVQGASIEGAIRNTRVYVTETDITDTQNRVKVSESEARF